VTASPPCRPVATIGLHGSASTWVFNVVRELLITALGEGGMLAAYADRVEQVPAGEAGRQLLLKSHAGSAEFDDWLEASASLVFLSIRDPRDAAISMTQRFRAPLGHTAEWLAADCAHLLRLAGRGHLLLRYEDGFYANSEVPGRLAHALGLEVDPPVLAAIFGRYATEAVRTFANNLASLPPERLTSFSGTTMDILTQIHRTHIGDGRSGKWRDLPPPARAELTRRFRRFLDRFRYPAD